MFFIEVYLRNWRSNVLWSESCAQKYFCHDIHDNSEDVWHLQFFNLLLARRESQLDRWMYWVVTYFWAVMYFCSLSQSNNLTSLFDNKIHLFRVTMTTQRPQTDLMSVYLQQRLDEFKEFVKIPFTLQLHAEFNASEWSDCFSLIMWQTCHSSMLIALSSWASRVSRCSCNVSGLVRLTALGCPWCFIALFKWFLNWARKGINLL